MRKQLSSWPRYLGESGVRGTGTFPDDGTLRRASYRSSMDDDIDGAWRDTLDAPELSRLSLSLKMLSAAALCLRGASGCRLGQAYATSSMSSVVCA